MPFHVSERITIGKGPWFYLTTEQNENTDIVFPFSFSSVSAIIPSYIHSTLVTSIPSFCVTFDYDILELSGFFFLFTFSQTGFLLVLDLAMLVHWVGMSFECMIYGYIKGNSVSFYMRKV